MQIILNPFNKIPRDAIGECKQRDFYDRLVKSLIEIKRTVKDACKSGWLIHSWVVVVGKAECVLGLSSGIKNQNY